MYDYYATVTKVVDGDTIDVDIQLGFHVTIKQRLRLIRIDTPERGRPGFHEATNRVKELAPVGSTVRVHTVKTGKFGRWLAEVYYPNGEDFNNLNTLLLNEGLAKPY